jgi:hypothetical protein
MIKRIIILLIFLFIEISIHSQNQVHNDYFSIIESKTGLFLESKPIKIYFSASDTSDIKWLKNEPENRNLQWPDNVIIKQLYNNCNNYDSSRWSVLELPKSIFISNKPDYVSFKAYKLQHTDLSDSLYKTVKKLIRKWNNTETESRELYYASRPVYDDNKNYAIIQIGFDCGNLCGSNWIILYKIENKEWQEIVYLKNKKN